MVMPYGFIDIIFRKDILERKGLLSEILERYKPTNEHIDDKLILVPCAMNPVSAGLEVDWLKEKGLTYIQDKKAVDFVLVESFLGTRAKCDWIKKDTLKADLIVDNRKYVKGTKYYEFIDIN